MNVADGDYEEQNCDHDKNEISHLDLRVSAHVRFTLLVNSVADFFYSQLITLLVKMV